MINSSWILKLSSKYEKEIIDLTKADSFSFSAIVRKLRKLADDNQVLFFLKLYKKYFDHAVLSESEIPDNQALQQALREFSKKYEIKLPELETKASVFRFAEVAPGIYRGSCPTPQDVLDLKNKYGIKKIVSLDQECSDKIDRTCQIVNIDHQTINLDGKRKSLLILLSKDFKELFITGGPTFIHCRAGKDRTGLVCALLECKYFGSTPDEAIKKAKSMGFGVGLDPVIQSLYERTIRQCKPDSDVNSADIVSNEREYIGDNKDSYLDEAHQKSFSPYFSTTKHSPFDDVYNDTNEEFDSRENHENYNLVTEINKQEVIPQVGGGTNSAGVSGGASFNGNLPGQFLD